MLSSCADNPLPEYPKVITKQYTLIVKNKPINKELMLAIENKEEFYYNEKEANCLEFDILSVNPYKVKFIKDNPIEACHLLTGVSASHFKALFNWIEEVYEWASHRKTCFKQ